jgi:cytoskeletal protein RodZ
MDAKAELGLFLRMERERRGLTLEQICDGTKIPRNSLERLEEGDWDALPAAVFVRGFVQSYGREVGLEVEALERYQVALNESSAELPVARSSESVAEAGIPAEPDDEAEIDTAIKAIKLPTRFGVALVVLLLLIIVTLTVSLLWGAGSGASQRAALEEGANGPALSAPTRRGDSSC